MIRKFIVWALGLSIKVVSVKEGDVLIFEAREETPIEEMEWYALILKKHFKNDIVVLRGLSLKVVVRSK